MGLYIRYMYIMIIYVLLYILEFMIFLCLRLGWVGVLVLDYRI